MHCITTAFLILLLSSSFSEEQADPQLRFLSQLLEVLQKSVDVNTIYMLRHTRAINCLIEDWKPRDMPIIRSTEKTTFEIIKSFNSFYTMAVICITQDSDVGLLNNLSRTLNHMRQSRIILWLQVKITKELMEQFCTMAEKHQFAQILVLESGRSGNASVKTYRLEPFPRPHFVLTDIAVNFNNIFQRSLLNFQGKEAIVLPKKDPILRYNISYGPNRSIIINSDEDRHIVEFSLRRNLSLKFYQGHYQQKDDFDLQLSPRLVTLKDIAESANPFTVVSLIVVVPCNRMRTIGEVFKRLDIKSNLLYILPVYATFVAVETLILLVTHRINGRAYQLTSLNPLLNLRAFRAILGLSFPISRRANPSLRQLFLAISVFGLIFSNFFSCKLTALLTQHSYHPQVTNFHELRDSNLTVIVNSRIRTYIENEIDPNFFNKTIIRVTEVSYMEMTRLLLSLNDSYAFIFVSDTWSSFQTYQKSLRRKVLCGSKDLTIIHGMPKMHVLQKNSIYDWPLSKFLWRIHETGIYKHWINEIPYILQNLLNVSLGVKHKRKDVPLRIADFNWLWLLLGCGYGLATIVFIIELTLRGLRQKNMRREPRENDSVA
ncbi:hypothetical protein KR032_010844 [Drosophila birchii]|nr:hypothetical protein KR032_010844 [Drosophila birchii]